MYSGITALRECRQSAKYPMEISHVTPPTNASDEIPFQSTDDQIEIICAVCAVHVSNNLYPHWMITQMY